MLPLNSFNLEDLAQALEFNFMDLETFFWLDPTTGKIELWGEEAADEAEAEGWDLDDRGGIRIDPIQSYEGYSDMEGFISTVQDPTCQDRLIRAIERSKPFRHFQDALHQYPGLPSQWYAFHAAAMKERAIEWLRDNDQVEDTEAEGALAQLRAEAQ
ncbi:UPF0158 family protein [Arthrobacter sp. HLT1-20]